MSLYKITFCYDGKGETMIEGRSRKDAVEKFRQGYWRDNEYDDDSDNYEILDVNRVRRRGE